MEYATLAIWTIFFILHGTVYGLQILHSPTEPKWTWSSVFTGVGCILVAINFYFARLDNFNLDPAMLRAVAIFAGAAVYGAPMTLSQIWKLRKVNQKSSDIREKGNFDE